jgi:hypothetical protein
MSKIACLFTFLSLIVLNSSFAQTNQVKQAYSDAISFRVFHKTGHVEQLVNQIEFVLYKDSTVVRFWDQDESYKESRMISINRSLIQEIEQFENEISEHPLDGEDYIYSIEFDESNAEIRYQLTQKEANILTQWFQELSK